ncbi:hypothetical protein GCM10007079_30080 [Nocardiopsis terrae]|nr:hypothetical protein GCM10007079_30080 [Nocardiopsis terrae]
MTGPGGPQGRPGRGRTRPGRKRFRRSAPNQARSGGGAGSVRGDNRPVGEEFTGVVEKDDAVAE